MCSNKQLTESHEQYGPPKIMKPKTTCMKYYEQFLWREFYDEYIRYNERQHLKPGKIESEYRDEFCKNKTIEDEKEKEKLHAQFPLYCTVAITAWNKNGDQSKDFKKRYAITRAVHEQRGQWDC